MATIVLPASAGSNPLVAQGTAGATYGTNTIQLTGLQSIDGAAASQNAVILVINISAFTSGTLTVQIQGLTATGIAFPSAAGGLLSSTALAAAAVTSLSIGPGLPATANFSANSAIPSALAITITPASTPVFTFGIDYIIGV
jgi:hypothetical protein